MSQSNTPTRVNELRSILGRNVVLLPIPVGLKGPIIHGWNTKTVRDLDIPAYVEHLEAGNIGVLLGKPSSGLCTVDIDDDGNAEQFLKLNPQLATSLRTRGARGANIWLRIIGDYPALVRLQSREGLAWGEWRADGGQTVIDGTHPNGNRYTRIVDAPPVEIEFQDIIWPDNLTLPWVQDECARLEERYGPPFILGNTVQISEGHFVGRFACENSVLFEPQEGEFYLYNEANGLWQTRTEDYIKKAVADSVREIAEESDVESVKHRVTDKLTTAIKNSLRGQVEVRNPFDGPPSILHLKNGMLNLDNDPIILETFSAEFFSRNQMPVNFVEGATCPQFEEALNSVLGREDVSLFQRWGGSVILGVNVPQRFMVLYGEAGTGKSTSATVVETIIGVENVGALRTKFLADRFELYGCVGKTLLVGKDVSADFLNQPGAHVIKALCGGDLIEAEKKGSGRIQLRGNYNILINANSKLWLNLEGDANAWRRRLLLIEFKKPRTTKTIPDFANKLFREEASGILNFFIEGAEQLRRELRDYGDYFLTQDQRDRIEKLVSESESVTAFVQARVITEPSGQLTTDALVTEYTRFCESRGWQPLPARTVQKQLLNAMMAVHRVASRHDLVGGTGSFQRGYKGVTFNSEGNRVS